MAAAPSKAVILAAGLGTRMRKSDDDAAVSVDQAAVADTGVKALIPIGRPFLDYVLSVLVRAGYGRVCLVVGPDHDQLRHYYQRQLRTDRIQIDFAVQPEPRGTADAVLAAEPFVDGEPFLTINSDNYYPLEAVAGLRGLEGSGVAVFSKQTLIARGNIPEERVRRFSVVEIGAHCLCRIIEKPDPQTLEALGDLVYLSMNCWRFTPLIFDACRRIRPSARGEFELPDAVGCAIDQFGERFEVLRFESPVLDLASRGDIESVAEHLAGVEVDL